MIYNEFCKPLFNVFVIMYTDWIEYNVYDAEGFVAIHIVPLT